MEHSALQTQTRGKVNGFNHCIATFARSMAISQRSHSNPSFKLTKLNQDCHYSTDRSTKDNFDRQRSTTILICVIGFHTTAHSLMTHERDC